MKTVIALVVMFISVSAQGAIYKWVDERGVTQYSETPPPNKQNVQKVDVRPGTPTGGAAPVKTWQEQELGFRQRLAESEEAKRKGEQELAEKRARKQQCTAAKRNLHILQMQVPVYRINEKGEQVFVDDDKRAAEIAAAKRDVETACQA